MLHQVVIRTMLCLFARLFDWCSTASQYRKVNICANRGGVKQTQTVKMANETQCKLLHTVYKNNETRFTVLNSFNSFASARTRRHRHTIMIRYGVKSTVLQCIPVSWTLFSSSSVVRISTGGANVSADGWNCSSRDVPKMLSEISE